MRILSFVALVLVTACADPVAPSVEPLTSTEPFLRGVITAHDPHWGFLVEARPPEASTVEAAWVRPDEDTEVRRPGTGGVKWESLSEGQIVSVWIDGPVMESLPVKVVAGTIVVE